MNRLSRIACVLALALLAVSGKVALAQDHGDHHEQHGKQQQVQFRDEDRRATEDWYRQHHQNAPAGWREQDRLPPGIQDRLRPGQALDRDMRSRLHALPPELSRRYALPPKGYRYAVIGGNVVLLDYGYVVHDVFTVTFQQEQARFRDEDRRATEDWYREHHHGAPAGWRDEDRLPPDMQNRLRAGRPLDPDLRSRMQPLPSELSRRYAPPPPGYHYGVIGGNVVLLDNGYVVHDVFSITFQIH